jgi:hypothetical protein
MEERPSWTLISAYSPLMRKPVLRPAQPCDFPFCERLYFAEMDHIITRLGLEMAGSGRALLGNGTWQMYASSPCPAKISVGCRSRRPTALSFSASSVFPGHNVDATGSRGCRGGVSANWGFGYAPADAGRGGGVEGTGCRI